MRVLIYLTLLIVTYEYAFNWSLIEAAKTETVELIHTYEEDVTGDGMKETIELKGISLAKGTKYYQDLWIDIKSPYLKQEWKVAYGGGYEPTLKFIDLNNDQTVDLFFQSSNDLEGDYYNVQMHTINIDVIKKIPQPKQWHISGKFKDNFTVDLNIFSKEKPITINIGNKQNEYVQQGIYNEQGKLAKDTSIHIEPISKIEPLLVNKYKGHGIKTTQQIHGLKTDLLGTVETQWYFENNKWIILQSKWNPV